MVISGPRKSGYSKILVDAECWFFSVTKLVIKREGNKVGGRLVKRRNSEELVRSGSYQGFQFQGLYYGERLYITANDEVLTTFLGLLWFCGSWQERPGDRNFGEWWLKTAWFMSWISRDFQIHEGDERAGFAMLCRGFSAYSGTNVHTWKRNFDFKERVYNEDSL